MKQTVITETTICDECGADGAYYTCRRCGDDRCYKCSEKSGKNFTHAVNFSGSGDGYYCDKCIEALLINGNDKLFNAYDRINSLKQERECFYTNFAIRAKTAEEELQKLLK